MNFLFEIVVTVGTSITRIGSFCSGTVSDSRKEISSPNYSNNYTSNRDCEWSITAQTGTRIELQFLDFQTQTRDYLRIHDGSSRYSNQIGSNLFGQSLPNNILSTGNQMYLSWNADSSDGEAKGFKIKVRTISKHY